MVPGNLQCYIIFRSTLWIMYCWELNLDHFDRTTVLALLNLKLVSGSFWESPLTLSLYPHFMFYVSYYFRVWFLYFLADHLVFSCSAWQQWIYLTYVCLKMLFNRPLHFSIDTSWIYFFSFETLNILYCFLLVYRISVKKSNVELMEIFIM